MRTRIPSGPQGSAGRGSPGDAGRSPAARPSAEPPARHLLGWSIGWLLATPVFALAGAGVSMGDPGTVVTAMALPLTASFGCSVAAFVRGRQAGSLVPAGLVVIAVAALGIGAWQGAHRGNAGIPADVVAVDVTYLDGQCRIPSDLDVAAGSHGVILRSEGGTRVVIRGPQPSTAVVYDYLRPGESEGFGPAVSLAAGTYAVTCSAAGHSAGTTLTVRP